MYCAESDSGCYVIWSSRVGAEIDRWLIVTWQVDEMGDSVVASRSVRALVPRELENCWRWFRQAD